MTMPPTHKAYCNVQFTYSAQSGPADGYDVGQVQHIRIGIGLPLNAADSAPAGFRAPGTGSFRTWVAAD